MRASLVVCRLRPAALVALCVGSLVLLAAPRQVSASTLSVCANGCAYSDFQLALYDAQAGDTITLRDVETFVGNFVLPAKSGSNTPPILIRSDAPDSAL